MMRYLLPLLALLLFQAVEGATVADLYTASVPVASRSDTERVSAMRSALGLVLIKLTGDTHAGSRGGVTGILGKASRMVQQFQYVDKAETGIDGESDPTYSLQLRVQFDPVVLEAAMQTVGLPIWGKERPSVLSWIAVDDGLTRKLLGTDDATPYVQVLRERARYRGIPLVLPLLDLEDAAALRADQSVVRPIDPVARASARYGTDAVLTGDVRQSIPGLWEAEWSLRQGDELDTWGSEGALPELVLEEGVDGLAGILAARFARAGATQLEGGFQIEVNGIFNVDDYARVQRYLNSLDGVSEIFVKQVEANRISFLIVAQGGAEILAQTIQLGGTLQTMEPAGLGRYRLLPQ